MASIDSASFFRNFITGAESPISLVFMVLSGESWGYLGSWRVFLESDLQSDSIKGLNLNMIETVIEIGSVGKSSGQRNKTFFAHTAGVRVRHCLHTKCSKAKTLNALHRAQKWLRNEGVAVRTASTANPRVPPSSLMIFLRKIPHIFWPCVGRFWFRDEFYHSHLDDLSNIGSSYIIVAASLVARTLYIQAGGQDPSTMENIKINESLVEEFLGCLLSCEHGLSCEMVMGYITPSKICPIHNVGLILGEPSSAHYPHYAEDISRFVWNYL